ncbi:MAG: DNA cytosine methyltransferase [Deltaproteobacteria bacterium]|jgi:DNA (cytosine-5)-methyltransferase 1|nr:DNA cytosine methyltransferase [Deltaproteobacteria bacterium]
MAKTGGLRALSIFSGAGGFDVGVRQAGFSILAELEIDPHCCATLRAANEDAGANTKVLEGDICTVSPEGLLNDFGLAPGELDLLFGGSPCQSFSLAGKQQGLNDARGVLLFEFIRFAEAFKPKVILLEQVKGLLSAKGVHGKRGEVFEDFLKRLEAAGYVPKWQVIMAADFGIPQLRERLFVVTTRGHNGFVFPQRTHAPAGECDNMFMSYLPYRTVGEVLGDLGEPDKKKRGQLLPNRLDGHVDVTPARDKERIAQVPEGSYLACQMHLTEGIRKGLSPKDTTKYLRLHRKRQSNTLRCGEIFYHPTDDRYLTPREYMRIHGYPDDYYLMGPIRSRTGTVRNLDQHRQVANSVPPPLAKILAEKIADYINE